MQDTVYTKATLPSGAEITVLDFKGRHFFNALTNCPKGQHLLKYLFCELIHIGGKRVTPEQLDEMEGRDVSYLWEVLNLQMN